MADNGFTKTYANGNSLTETQLDTAYKTVTLDISNTSQMTQGATAGHYLKCVSPGVAAQFAALPTAALPTTPTVSKSADYVITDTDGVYTVLVTTGTATITITLPTAADNAYRVIAVKKVDNGVGKVVIDGEGSETIDGLTTTTIYSRWETASVQCDGSNWWSMAPRVSSWVSFTPTGLWNTNVTYTGLWRRNGDMMDLQISIACSGAPNSANCIINMPTGFTIDTTRLPGYSNGDKVIGHGSILDGGSAAYPAYVEYVSTSTFIVTTGLLTTFSGTQYPRITNVTQAVPFTFGNTDAVMINVTVPVAEWQVNA